ncbi:MAG: winged helix DNA-binding domain-containing protein [Candidatus Cloacimonetes bacterium]|nr:winged helix DNA-binding domain-containing protein [Candidatus Cloacimonadota bacterium]
MKIINRKECRKLILQAQGFCEEFPAGQAGIMSVINRLGYVQIDTINIIQRAHLHVLWSRLPDFKEEDLQALLVRQQLFEYWTHAAAILPITVFPHTLHRKNNFSWKDSDLTSEKFLELTRKVYERVVQEGETETIHFQDGGQEKNGVWFWKPSKTALETLFHQGKLMVKKRRSFRRVYDLTERVYPASAVLKIPEPEETAFYQIRQALQANGIMTFKEISNYLCFAPDSTLLTSLQQMEKKGEIIKAQVEGEEYYLFNRIEPEKDYKNKVFIISPFDNLTINRQRLENIFALRYRLECYVPAAKRKLGYFMLPLLYQDEFIGMLDAKAERKTKRLIILKFIKLRNYDNELKKLLEESIAEFALFNGCPEVVWI